MATNFIGVLLPTTPNYTVDTGFSTQLYDAAGNQTITVQAGASLQLVGSLGSNTLRLSGNTSAWQVMRDGSTVVLTSTDGSRVELAATTTLQTLQFDNGTRDLQIDTSGASPSLKLGAQTLGTEAAAIAAVDAPPPPGPENPGEGSSTKAPWTLVMATSGYGDSKILVSDGSADGTAIKQFSDVYFWYGVSLLTNSEKSGVYFYDRSSAWSDLHQGGSLASNVGFTDGTVAGTELIIKNTQIPSTLVSLNGDKLLMSGARNSFSNEGLAYSIDGSGKTYSSTDLDYAIRTPLAHDINSQSYWSTAYASPYGNELVRFDYSSLSKITASMVKDINPGTASGIDSWSFSSALLPNGKLIFRANDGIHGNEAWVSDGTETGTFMLKDYDPGNYGDASGFKIYGETVAFRSLSDKGHELAFTDGTTSGTTLLDINPGHASSNPNVLGEANGLLYFTAEAFNQASNSTLKGIYSTNGSTFTKLATIGNSASLLGWDTNKAFFKVADAAHGEELWVADFSANSFSLVKDILPGSGSALANQYNTQAFMVAGKLVFQAFTTATQQQLFVSDGTDAGTVQLGTGLPTKTQVLGDTLVYGNASGVFAVNLAAATPSPVQLSATGLASAITALQTDADQMYFLTSAGDLFASTGASAPTAPLASKVSQFKVVAENAVFFVQTNSASNVQSLWYSDGSAAGTRFIEDLPAGSYDLSNAVAIHTAGLPLPADTVAPVFQHARVNGDQLTLTFTETSTLDASNIAATTAFTLSGTSATISSVAVNAAAKTVTLTLSEAVKSTDSIKVSYTDPTAGNDSTAIQDAAGNDAASFSNRSVTNQTPDNVGPVFGSATVNGSTLTLSYTDASLLDAANLPASTAFTLGGTSATVSSVAVNAAAKTVTLTLSEAVKSTDAVMLNYTDPTAGNDAAAIQDALGNDAASLVNQAVSNLTPVEPVKAPWTLVMASNQTIFRSDGTGEGTGYLSNLSFNSYGIYASPDKNSALFKGYFYQSGTTDVYRIDGASTAAEKLASNVYLSNSPIIVGNQLVFGDGNSNSHNGLITDGTAAGSKLVADLPLGIVDTANQAMWASISTAPYGQELFRIDLTAAAPSYSMVKDIYSGSSSGIDSWNFSSALLPNGNLIFSATDGLNGYEPWFSDGTEAGTFMLTNLSNSSRVPYDFHSFGQKIAFIGYASNWNDGKNIINPGVELVFTDGTAVGTTVLDVDPGHQYGERDIIGVANNLMYFTATVGASKGIYSTDSNTFTKLADINSSASLLAWDGNKAFFKVSDATHGEELWVADLVNNSFTLVKDILAGSGSGLTGDTQAMMVGGKLVFQAYTSATEQKLFISDGTTAGTVQVGDTLGQYRTLGDTLVFADGKQVKGLDLSSANASPVSLVDAGSALAKLQFDADQAFFTLSNGDLYATGGTVNTTVLLAQSVQNFKVFEDNAIYWVQSNNHSATGYSLGYSDGTADGTRLIEDAPANISSNLDNAVVIHTVGVVV